MPRFPPSRLVRRLPARRHHVLARLRLWAGIRQPLTVFVVRECQSPANSRHSCRKKLTSGMTGGRAIADVARRRNRGEEIYQGRWRSSRAAACVRARDWVSECSATTVRHAGDSSPPVGCSIRVGFPLRSQRARCFGASVLIGNLFQAAYVSGIPALRRPGMTYVSACRTQTRFRAAFGGNVYRAMVNPGLSFSSWAFANAALSIWPSCA